MARPFLPSPLAETLAMNNYHLPAEGLFLQQQQPTKAEVVWTNADYATRIVNILNTKETLVYGSSFQLPKVKAN